MSVVNLGEVPAYDAQRDAVHVAVVPLKAGEDLQPGDRVRIDYGVLHKDDVNCVAIVDPFRKGTISRYSQVWVLMQPNEVTKLRHTWEHYDVPSEEDDTSYDDGCRGCW